jgi:acetyltransferase-like isoleucine patch superfamily enzyme
MWLIENLRRGQGPVWSRLKRTARAGLAIHLPVNAATRPVWRGLYAVHVTARESLIWARRFFWNEPLFRSQCASVGEGFWMEELPYLHGRGHIEIGRHVRFSGKPHFAFNNQRRELPRLTIGDGTFLGHLCDLRIAGSLTIGRHCLLAGGVSIADYDGHPLDAAARRSSVNSPPPDARPVTIGDDVWIGRGAVVLKGVSIGDRAVIGAGAVVSRDVPSDCVVAGNPARPVRDLSPNERLGPGASDILTSTGARLSDLALSPSQPASQAATHPTPAA